MSDIALQSHAGFTSASRFVVGACGGLAAVCVKFLGQDLAYMQQLFEAGDAVSRTKLVSLGMAYSLFTPILMFLGGIIGWASEETTRLKLLAMGVAAPALVTTWAGGTAQDGPGTNIAGAAAPVIGQLLPVTPAFAQERPQLAQAPNIGQGVRLFFGIGKQEPRFTIVVGEHDSLADAEMQVKTLKAESPGLEILAAGPTAEGTYRVVVGDYASFEAAERVRDEIDRLQSVEDATVSNIGAL
jgi:hypothetical protein